VRRTLEFKMVSVVVLALLVVAVSTGLLAFTIQRGNLYTVAASSMETTADVLLQEIEATLLEGKTEETKAALDQLRKVKGMEDLAVINSEGREAFKWDSPIQDSQVIREFETGKGILKIREKSGLIFYTPLRNSVTCQKCHGTKKAILGAVRFSHPLQDESRMSMRFIMVMTAAALVLFILMTALAWFMLKRLVVSRIRSLEVAAARLSEGDLSFDVEQERGDEIGRLSRSFKESFRSIGKVFLWISDPSDKIAKVTDDITVESKHVIKDSDTDREAITTISAAVEELSSAASKISDNTESLASSVEETSVSMDEMVSSVSHVNDHMHELAEAVESTSSSIQEMSATIKQVAINAEELATASQETLSAISEITSTIREVELTARESARLSERATSDAATLGMASVEKTIGGMERIKASVERTAEFIQRLGGRSDEIGTILTVIDEVTDQTTLLALNAAILAAQAGEHGKGFSVVADEIKDLAERTAFSTQEIGTLIQSVQQEVKHSVEAMQDGLRSVEEGFSVTKEAESALRKILDGSKQTSEMAVSIERSTSEQSRAAKFVAEAMERVRNMTDQIAKSTMEQSKGILLIMKATEKMRDISRLALKATEEQTSSSRQISQAMDLVSEKSQQISHSLSYHKAGTRQILSTVDTLKKIPLEKRDHAFKISNTIEELHRDAQLLRAEIDRFTPSGGA
jgi:methyl-accepting chemotaxis protein